MNVKLELNSKYFYPKIQIVQAKYEVPLLTEEQRKEFLGQQAEYRAIGIVIAVLALLAAFFTHLVAEKMALLYLIQVQFMMFLLDDLGRGLKASLMQGLSISDFNWANLVPPAAPLQQTTGNFYLYTVDSTYLRGGSIPMILTFVAIIGVSIFMVANRLCSFTTYYNKPLSHKIFFVFDKACTFLLAGTRLMTLFYFCCTLRFLVLGNGNNGVTATIVIGAVFLVAYYCLTMLALVPSFFKRIDFLASQPPYHQRVVGVDFLMLHFAFALLLAF